MIQLSCIVQVESGQKTPTSTTQVEMEIEGGEKKPFKPGYWQNWVYSRDPAQRAEWPVGPWPVPWFRGLHSWSMCVLIPPSF